MQTNSPVALTSFHIKFCFNFLNVDHISLLCYSPYVTDERLFWTETLDSNIFSVKPDGTGYTTLFNMNIREMLPRSVVYQSGWLVFLNSMKDELCIMRGKEGAIIHSCTSVGHIALGQWIHFYPMLSIRTL